MNHLERFECVMNFKPVDRLPVIEWAEWWDLTLRRWRTEGLSEKLVDPDEIREYLGLDPYHQCWISPLAKNCPEPDRQGSGWIQSLRDYHNLKPYLYPRPGFEESRAESWSEGQKKGNGVVWITLEGFFWFPRSLLGIEGHLFTFYDDPELIHTINRDLVEYNLKTLEAFCRLCTPNFLTIAEDMSYNHGPMVSKDLFDEFLSPYYRQILPQIKQHGIVPFMDSDGNVTQMVPWLEEIGIEGILPLEKMAGVDVHEIRKRHPGFKMIGAFDKTVMHRGEEAIEGEFERLLPTMIQGGFIPSVDHQTPPDVSLSQYKCYVSLLKKYCIKAAQ